MRFEITHRTIYTYSGQVYLEPHAFRFRPRSDGSQRLLEFQLSISPQPVIRTDCLDTEGNVVTQGWFEGLTDRLEIRAHSVVETLRADPFDFLLTDIEAATLPILYSDDLRPLLAPYRDTVAIDWDVRAFSDAIAQEVGWETLPYLPALNQCVHASCKHEVRERGGPHPGKVTLEHKRGACRDLAVLFIEACRAQGLAARFVSGYQHGAEQGERRLMHAWAEVYLPGGGWRGYDPSHGLAAADYVVAVAAGAQPRAAAPVTGTFRGTGVTQTMEFEIEIR